MPLFYVQVLDLEKDLLHKFLESSNTIMYCSTNQIIVGVTEMAVKGRPLKNLKQRKDKSNTNLKEKNIYLRKNNPSTLYYES